MLKVNRKDKTLNVNFVYKQNNVFYSYVILKPNYAYLRMNYKIQFGIVKKKDKM